MASRLLELRGDSQSSSASRASLSHLLARATSALNRLVAREDAKCQEGGGNFCEKPAVSSQSTTWIIVGVIIGVLVISTLSIMLFFHLKKKKRDQREDLDDQFQMSDYGLDEGQMPAGRAKQPRGPQRLSFDDLPRPGGPPTRNPFSDDAVSDRPHEGLSPPNAPWPKRADSSESGQSNGAPLK